MALVLDLPAQLLDEVLVVGDDDQLEVAVVGALLDQLGQGEGQRLDVVAVLGTVKGYFITKEKITTLINEAKLMRDKNGKRSRLCGLLKNG